MFVLFQSAKEMEAPKHMCLKNWDSSSSAMEQDMIVDGFCRSEEMHSLRYISIIGDGDSSVEIVPYGRRVKKLECANHAVRCYRKSLHDLVSNHPDWKGRNGLTELKIRKLSAGARAAIRMHAKTGNVDQLRKDLRNGPYHVFGDHRNCNEEFCTSKQAQKKADCETLLTLKNKELEKLPKDNENKLIKGCVNNERADTTVCDEIIQIIKELEEEKEEEAKQQVEKQEARRGGQYMISFLMDYFPKF